jgi:hypothetical protein
VSQSESREEELACTTTKEPLLIIYNNNNNNNNKEAGKHNPPLSVSHFELVVRLQRKNIINVPHTLHCVSHTIPHILFYGNSFPHETNPKKEKKLTLQNQLKKRGTKLIN